MSSPFIPESHVHSFQLWRSVSCCFPQGVGRRCAQQVVGHQPHQTGWEWGGGEEAAPGQLRPVLCDTLLLGKSLALTYCLAAWLERSNGQGVELPWSTGKGRAARRASGYLGGSGCLTLWCVFDISGAATASLVWGSILKCQLNQEDDILLLAGVARTL